MKKVISSILLCIFFLFLLLFPKNTVKSASEGLSLWLNTLVPTLLPIMIISNLLVATRLSARIAYPFHPIFHKLFGVGIHGTYALISGFLCGFPMGAKIVSDLYKNKLLTKEEAHYLCAFCNNVSPAFVINYILTQPMNIQPIPVFLILYGSPLLFGLLTRYNYNKTSSVSSSNKASFTALNFAMIDACITNSIHSITKLGGYIILFSVATTSLTIILSPYPTIKAALIALTELTTGIPMIMEIPSSSKINCTLLIFCTSFGGLCTAAQYHAVLHSIKMTMQQYIRAKFCIAVISAILSVCYLF